MALIYQYDDTFITNSVEVATHEKAETDALIDLGKQGVTDTYYLEKMCVCLVYISLCNLQLEADGMTDKLSTYRKDYDRYQRMSNFQDTDEGVFSGTVGRG